MFAFFSQKAYLESQFLAPPDPDTCNGSARDCVEHNHAAKGIFSHFVHSVEHTWEERQQTVNLGSWQGQDNFPTTFSMA